MSGPSSLERPSGLRRALRKLGPGLITGASDDDPSGIATYASAGARLGYAPLWTAAFTLPLMFCVQLICAKIGMVTGRGIAGVLRERGDRVVLALVVVPLIVANTINAGVDLGAIAEGVRLLVDVPRAPLLVFLGLVLTIVPIVARFNTIARVLKWLTLALLAYVGAAAMAAPDVRAAARGTFVPQLTFDRTWLELLVGILGTTISPYLFFWQASHEVEEERAQGRSLVERRGATPGEISDASVDVGVGMLASNVVMYCVILATAATLHAKGHLRIDTAAQAAEALRPVAGDMAGALFALGLIGTGALAVPVLTGSAAFALCEACGWRASLDAPLREAPRFYLAMAAFTVLGLAINFLGFNAVDLLVWTAVLNGLLAPPLLVVIMRISGDEVIMGEHVHGRALGVAGWSTALLMGLAALALLAQWVL